MAVKTQLDLEIRGFNAKLEESRRKVRETTETMKRDARGVGDAMAGGMSKGLGGAMGLLGIGGGIGGVAAGIKQALAYADDLSALTYKLGENAETIQRVDFAARQAAGMGIDQISDAMLDLEKNLGEMDADRAAASLARLGLTAADLMDQPLDRKILSLSEAFGQARAEGTGYADLIALIGEGAKDLLPLLSLSKDELEGLFERAPAMTGEQVAAMARLNDEFDELIEKSKVAAMQTAGSIAGMVKWVDDFARAGYEEAMIRLAERAEDAEAKAASAGALGKGKAAATEAARAHEAAEKAAKEDADRADKMRETLAGLEMDLLPDDAKLAAFQAKLAAVLDESVGAFPAFEKSIAGLEKLLAVRESRGQDVTGALEWVVEAKKLQGEIGKLESARATALDRMRAAAGEGEFRLLDPDDQARRLRDQLSTSLGVDITGIAAIEQGLSKLRTAAKQARDSGDTAAEQAALDQLTKAQDQYGSLRGLTMDGGKDRADAGQAERGTLQAAMNQIFGRAPEETMLTESKAQTGLLKNIDRTLKEMGARLEIQEEIFTI